MGESKQNINALMRDTLPTFPPLNRQGGADIGLRCVPKQHVYLVGPEGEPDAADLADHAQLCQEIGREQIIHRMGTLLRPELCDVALIFIVGWVDTGASPPNVGRHVIPGEVARLDMQDFLTHAEASIGGGSRIIRPMIELAQH